MRIDTRLTAVAAGFILVFSGCAYQPYPDGEPKNYTECIEKSSKTFTSSAADRERAVILTEKSCREKFPAAQ